MKVFEGLADIRHELENAERKFPNFPTDPVHAAAIVGEETGELTQAALQFTYEHGNYAALYKEAVQVGAMVLRFLLNIDNFIGRPSNNAEPVQLNTTQKG